jgi:molybdate transport system regulatory protein
MEPKFNLWIEQNGEVVLSAWRAKLLEAIGQTGSISAAAEQLKVPYRRAWEKVQEMEAGLGEKLVDTAVGGAGVGGAHLTPAAEQALARFRAFEAGFAEVVASRFQAAFRPTRGARQ